MHVTKDKSYKKKIMVVASKGGHWIQLQRLKPVWADQNVVYVSTDKSLKSHVENSRFENVIDASMDQKFRLIVQAISTLVLVLKHRPNIIISTGAAVGFFAIFWGRLIGAKTVWLDSVANADELSLAGKKVGKIATIWLTQWPELATIDGPDYQGRVF
jgi:UDP-N-acetylglucosamine:LPS N-acetylglucosamine transferase